jgi:hypothetical protein
VTRHNRAARPPGDGPPRCDKIPYASRREAAAAAAGIARRHRKSARMEVYQCRDCQPGTWHLTKQRGRWRARLKGRPS